MGKVCPRCGKAIPRGALHNCHLATAPVRNKQRERERRSKELWREGYDKEYRQVRNGLLTASGGLCEACGEQVFVPTHRGWRKARRDFGGTHHLVPLSQGGANSTDNLTCLCARCHGIAHSHAFIEAANARGVISKSWALRFIRELYSD